jgi:predicted dehydrogenase
LQIVAKSEAMLRVAIIGCGKIADDHLQQLRRIPGCEVVGACDLEPLMAQQLSDRFQIKQTFSNTTHLLKTCSPDVVHITTPPLSHFALGKQCLEAGCHVYIEKPFALNTNEAETLVAFAEKMSLKLTVGHDLQFSPAARRMRQLVREGYLGSAPIHLESYYCYDLTDPGYAKALLSDSRHWVRKLPGKLLHNIISHGIARIAEFVPTDAPYVLAHGFVSPLLKRIGEDEIVDELRVTISDTNRATAYFTFSSQMRPSLNLFRMFGSRNGLELDQDRETLMKLRGDRFKSYAEKFIPPLNLAAQQLGNLGTNLRKFLANDFHMKSGMKCLIESFYHSIVDDAPLPIPYREILLTSRIMDAIFEQLNARSAVVPPQEPWEAGGRRMISSEAAFESKPEASAANLFNR